jgi:hypothetical protein
MAQFSLLRLEAKKLRALAYVTDELLRDAAALGAWLERMFALEASFVFEDQIVNGSGAGRPLGILTPRGIGGPRGAPQPQKAKNLWLPAVYIACRNLLARWQNGYPRWQAARASQSTSYSSRTATARIATPAGLRSPQCPWAGRRG